MYNYKELGLQSMDVMMRKANEQGYAVPAFNFISIEQFNAIIDACIELESPVILLVSPNLLRQLGGEIIARIAQSGVDRANRKGVKLDIALHLDHGMSLDDCIEAIKFGFSSVMIDGSHLSYDENIRLTKEVVSYAKQHDVSVEAELGTLAGEEEGSSSNSEPEYTDPIKAIDFIKKTNVDCLAVSVGTNHGLIKMKPKADGSLPELRFDILSEINDKLPNFPLVLHGASNLNEKYIAMINNYGGKIEKTLGIPDEQIEKAAKANIAKINIASDGWIPAVALTRKILHENPGAIDSRVFTLEIREELSEVYRDKIYLFNSAYKTVNK